MANKNSSNTQCSEATLGACGRPAVGTVVLDFPRPLLFCAPREVLVAHTVAEVEPVLRRVDEVVGEGMYAAGYLAYEAGFAFEESLRENKKLPDYPLAWFGVYERSAEAYAKSERASRRERFDASFGILLEEYSDRVERIRELIASGEFYQLNFTDSFAGEYKGDAWDVYSALRVTHPVPYASFIQTDDVSIASLSPELFFAEEGERIWMRPMKGTAGRGRTLAEDREIAAKLARDEKNRAENVMIVDLVRNDLGKICETGSVRPERLCEVERFSTVHQMTSTVSGTLRLGTKPSEIITALFPSGSVTGAPKLRTMEWIAKLERAPRGVYTGAIGYFGPNEAVMNVAIRTLIMRDGRLTLGVGSAITFGSSAVDEYEECNLKRMFLNAAAQPEFALIESLLWDRGFEAQESPGRLDRHIARLRDSAEYFDFVFDETNVRAKLAEYSPPLAGRCKVRLQLRRNGNVELTHSDVPERRGRVMIFSERVYSSDRFLFHKTTIRDVYDRALQAALDNGCDDALLFNERGELTEGAIHNVFIREGECWFTPPISCGLLAGVARAELLSTLTGVREEMITKERLLAADEVWLCNAVRGFYKVTPLDETLTRANIAYPSCG